MSFFLEKLFSWGVCEFILSALLFANYRVFEYFARSASDRYNYLRMSFGLLLIVPFFQIHSLLPVSRGTAARAIVDHVQEVVLSTPIFSHFWHFVVVASGGIYFIWLMWQTAKFVYAFTSMKRLTDESIPLNLEYRWPVLLTERDDIGPMTVGILRPKVILQKKLFETLSGEELKMVLDHEFTHADQRDGFFNLLRLVVKELLPFSPFISKLSDHFEENMELSVDLKVLSHTLAAPRTYAELILRLSEQFRAPALAHSAIHLSKHFVAKRILSMKAPHSTPRRSLTFASTFVFLVLGVMGVSFLSVNTTAQAFMNSESIANSRYEVLKFQCSHGDVSCQNIVGTDLVYQLDTQSPCGCKPPVGIEMFQ